MKQIKLLIPLFFLGLLLALGLWSSDSETTVQSNALGVTSTPAVDLPTELPTEELTSTPVPTAIPQPTATPLPAATATPEPKSHSQSSNPLPTPEALPNLGGAAATGGESLSLAPVDRVVIPNLGIDSPVVRVPYENGAWDLSRLGLSIGWLETTSLPNHVGSTVLISHLNLIGQGGGPFQKLTQLRHGADIFVDGDGVRYHYRVTEIHVIAATDVSVLASSGQSQLILMTCFPYSWNESSQHYLDRLVVIAEQVPYEGD
jgi:LPXTG-site transpeptidase (sortase) family protein